MWSVVFYAPNHARRTLFRSEQRGEAEASKQRYKRLIGAGFKLEVVFDAPTAVVPTADKDDRKWAGGSQSVTASPWQASPYPRTQL